MGVENFPNSSIKSDEARLDVSARGFWVTGQKAFFDIRVFNPTLLRTSTLLHAKRKREETPLQQSRDGGRAWITHANGVLSDSWLWS